MSLQKSPLVTQTHPVNYVPDHPLSSLTASEIKTAARLVKNLFPGRTDWQFKAITLEEPPKAALIPFLEAEHAGKSLPRVERQAFVAYYLQTTGRLYEAVVNLSKQAVESNAVVGSQHHAPADSDEIDAVEEAVLKNKRVQAELKKLQLPPNTKFVCDPWIYGSDGNNDGRRMYSAYLYMRDPKNPENADSNHYAFPLAVLPVFDATTLELIRIDTLPTGYGSETKKTSKTKVHPPSEYTPEHQRLREHLKPLRVVQPQGASFRVTQASENNNVLDWQKWRIRIGFNQREGVVLYDIRYDSRSLFYRMALSDMNIPYADPRSPFHRKAAFDLGDVGAGIMANNLKLGCDCLGSIYYISSVISDSKGNPDPRPNAICIHEQDAGLLWKHTNYRTGRAAVVRNRELVIQSIITVANYEYILAFIFNQAGEVTYEVRATGIVSTQPIDEGVTVPWGTTVHPGALASHHQHILSLRIDPAIDGHKNTLVTSEAHAMPIDSFNPHGTGYTVEESTVQQSCGMDLDYDSNRVFKITNPTSRNSVNHVAVAYKIQAPPFQKMLAAASSFHYRRAEFADHNIYVTRHRDGEFYAGGKYTNQSRGGEGVRSWAARRDPLVAKDGKGGEDIVVWVQMGLNHVVRQEDWPVMPVETMKVSLKPCNFFAANPALDVPPSDQEANQSVLLTPEKGMAGLSLTNGESDHCGCPSEKRL